MFPEVAVQALHATFLVWGKLLIQEVNFVILSLCTEQLDVKSVIKILLVRRRCTIGRRIGSRGWCTVSNVTGC